MMPRHAPDAMRVLMFMQRGFMRAMLLDAATIF